MGICNSLFDNDQSTTSESSSKNDSSRKNTKVSPATIERAGKKKNPSKKITRHKTPAIKRKQKIALLEEDMLSKLSKTLNDFNASNYIMIF